MSTDLNQTDLSMFDGIAADESAVVVSPKRIEEGYNSLIHFREQLAIAVTAATLAKEAYDDGERDAYLHDMVQGKNAEIRAASLADILSKHTAALRNAKAAERVAELDYRNAYDEVDFVKLLVQLLGMK